MSERVSWIYIYKDGDERISDSLAMVLIKGRREEERGRKGSETALYIRIRAIGNSHIDTGTYE